MKVCNKCILPENFPGISFNNAGVCSYCLEEDNLDKNRLELQKNKKLKEMHKTINKIRGKKKYDCLLALSGGKDSMALLYILKKDYGLNVLAVTVDTGFLSKTALENAKCITKHLAVDHTVVCSDKELFKKIYKHLMLTTHTDYTKSICNICSMLMRGFTFNLAYDFKIPLIMHAFAPNQGLGFGNFPPILLRYKRWWQWPEKVLGRELYKEIEPYLWNPNKHLFERNLPRNYYPFHLIDYNMENIFNKISALNIIPKGNEDPLVTNCEICYLLLLLDRKKIGYTPFLWDYSQLVRSGSADRKVYLTKFMEIEESINAKEFHRETIATVSSKLNIPLPEV